MLGSKAPDEAAAIEAAMRCPVCLKKWYRSWGQVVGQLMAHENIVLRSIEFPEGWRCVDIFVRPDGTFGFEEFRQDPENGRGWFPIGYHSGGIFETEDAALNEAMSKVPWLREVVDAG